MSNFNLCLRKHTRIYPKRAVWRTNTKCAYVSGLWQPCRCDFTPRSLLPPLLSPIQPGSSTPSGRDCRLRLAPTGPRRGTASSCWRSLVIPWLTKVHFFRGTASSRVIGKVWRKLERNPAYLRQRWKATPNYSSTTLALPGWFTISSHSP